jgi:N-acetylglucosamine kinase-like BadF-type ATPase
MKYVVGIDGGGTKTILKIADEGGNLLTTCEGGPSNINSTPIGQVEDTLRSLMYKGINSINESINNLSVLCIGSAGVDRIEDKKIIENCFKNIGYSGKIIITNDAEIALYGGIADKEGLIVISGTGSICFGKDSSGLICRSGGWGHIIGDEGSGYYIGVNALKAVVRSYDGRDGWTLLTDMVLNYLQLKSPEGLIEYVYRSGKDKKSIAGVAKIVDKAFLLGDNTAKEILQNSAHELYQCAKAVIIKLGFNNKHVIMAVSGSVLSNNKFIFNEFSYHVNQNYPNIEIVDMKDDAAWGAVLLAIKKVKEMG